MAGRRGEITALLKLPFPAATTTSTTAAAAAAAAAGAHTHAPNTHFPARTHIQQARTDAPLAGAGNLNMQGLLSLPSFSPMEAEVSFQPIDVHSAMRTFDASARRAEREKKKKKKKKKTEPEVASSVS